MRNVIERIAKLISGLFLFAVGIVMTINADLGLAPWDVFHQGISKNTGMTMGQATILVGLVLLFLNIFLGEKVGWGTIGNMALIGMFMDLLMLNNLVPTFHNIILKIVMMLGGLFVIGIASYLYIGAGLGSGPRDALMIALTKKSKKSVRLVRNSIEITVLIIGYFLGGSVGIGTFVMALTVGYFVQFVFKIFKFDVNKVENRFIDEDIKFLKEVLIR